MREASHFVRPVSMANARATAQELAEKMRHEALGCLVVVDADRRPVGIVTDRDLALRVVAAGRRGKETTAESVMTQPLHSVDPSATIETVIDRMRSHGIRRMPVVRDRTVVGIVTLDDLVVHVSRELDLLGAAFRRQLRDARRASGLEALLEELRERLGPLADQLERAGEKTREILLRELDALRDRLRRP